jgi:hypothetical protein
MKIFNLEINRRWCCDFFLFKNVKDDSLNCLLGERKMGTEQLENIKEVFRNWYGSLSIEEIISNHNLVSLIEKIEAQLIALTSQGENYAG